MRRGERSEVTGRSGAKGMAIVAAASVALAVAAWLFAFAMSMFVA